MDRFDEAIGEIKMSDALSAVETAYFNIQTNLNPLLAACSGQPQKDQEMAQYVQARQKYWDCINKSFHDDDPALQGLVAQFKTVNTSLADIAKRLGDVAG